MTKPEHTAAVVRKLMPEEEGKQAEAADHSQCRALLVVD